LDESETDSELLKRLIKEARIVPVFDRLSERSDDTFQCVKTLRGTLPIGLALVSTRISPEYEGGNAEVIHPLPLESGGLMSFMSALLARHAHVAGLTLVREQTDLARRIAKLVEAPPREGRDVELPLTPLLVKLFVDRAVELLRTARSLGELPTSIPQVIADYLEAVNPEAADTPHKLSTEQMFFAARAVARASLEHNFVPQDVSITTVRAVLPQTLFGGSDPAERLKLNGILVERGSGTQLKLGFAHDPIAEYLAAEASVDAILEAAAHNAVGADDGIADFERLCAKVRKNGVAAQGFLIALEVVWRERTRERKPL
jgi:hypothetical protein